MNHSEVKLPKIKEQFRNLSLRELSIESLNLAQQIEENPVEDDESNLDQVLQDYLKEITAEKVDGYCFYADHLSSEIALWKQKRANLEALCDRMIKSQERRLKALEQTILRLHSLDLISKYLQGRYRAIEIRPNSQPSIEVLIPESQLPDRYQSTTIKANKKAIIQDYKLGKDVSLYAQVDTGCHVRFKIKRG